MMQTNLSVILYDKNDLRIENRSIPEPGPGEVQLRMQDAGICATDVHFWTNGKIANFTLTSPICLGHEASGVVSKLGQEVTNLAVGDRVAVEPAVPCQICVLCKRGRYNLCSELRSCAKPPINGNLANYYCHAANFCHKLPDSVNNEEGALLEPLSVAVHACQRAGVTIDSTVLISGAGPIGLLCYLTAKAMGAKKICVTEVDDNRLKFAKKIGVQHALSVKSGTSEELVSQIETTLDQRPEISIECSGDPAGLKNCMLVTGNGGCVVMVGLQPDDVSVPLLNTALREVDVIGSLRYVNCFPIALALIVTGKVDVKPLITHRYKLEDSVKAFEHAHTMHDGAVKIIIHCDQD